MHLDDGRRVGESGGLDHDVVKLVAAPQQLVEDADEITTHWRGLDGRHKVRRGRVCV